MARLHFLPETETKKTAKTEKIWKNIQNKSKKKNWKEKINEKKIIGEIESIFE